MQTFVFLGNIYEDHHSYIIVNIIINMTVIVSILSIAHLSQSITERQLQVNLPDPGNPFPCHLRTAVTFGAHH